MYLGVKLINSNHYQLSVMLINITKVSLNPYSDLDPVPDRRLFWIRIRPGFGLYGTRFIDLKFSIVQIIILIKLKI